MKKLFPIIFLLPLFCKAQTVQKDYNYITQSIAYLESKGLSQSEYTLKPWREMPAYMYKKSFGGIETYEFDFLYRNDQHDFCAAVVKITSENKSTYLCIPVPHTVDAIIEASKNDFLRILSTGQDRTFTMLWTILLNDVAKEYNK